MRILVFNALGWSLVGPAALAGVRPDIEADALDCELYVDDFALVTGGQEGALRTSLVVNLRNRARDAVDAVGFFAVYRERRIERTFSQGRLVDQAIVEAGFAESTAALNTSEDAWRVEFPWRWEESALVQGERQIQSFAFHVDLRDGAVRKRLWLKGPGRDFASEDFDPALFPYSGPVKVSEGAMSRYLWQDGGSPLFTSRQRCAG
jgi:hypothetical protein